MLKKFIYILVLLLIAKTVFAQTTLLHLQIIDQNSSLIPNVTVRIKSNSKIIQEIIKESPQKLTFSNLKVGKYFLEIQSEGFKPNSQEVEIKTGKNEITIKLEVAEIDANVDIKQDEQEKSIDNSFSNFLTKRQIEALSDDPKELEKQLKQIGGDDNVIIRVDGFTGGNLPQKSQIASIRMVRSSFDAENHELGFTYVNIATKPGNQRFSGSFSFNFNDESFNARNSFSPKRFPEQRKNTIFFLSGPIKKDKAAFSLTAIDFRNFKSQNINAILPAGLLNDSVNSNTAFTTINTTVNQNLSKYNNAKYDYEFTNTNSQNIGVGGFNLAERAFNMKSKTHQIRLSESGYISEKYLNELRFQFVNENSQTIPQNENVGVIVLDSFSNGGAGNFSKSHKLSLMFADNLLFGWKNHALKIGTYFEFEKRNEISETNKNGTFIFSSLSDFNLRKPSIFTQNSASREVNLSQIQFGSFV